MPDEDALKGFSWESPAVDGYYQEDDFAGSEGRLEEASLCRGSTVSSVTSAFGSAFAPVRASSGRSDISFDSVGYDERIAQGDISTALRRDHSLAMNPLRHATVREAASSYRTAFDPDVESIDYARYSARRETFDRRDRSPFRPSGSPSAEFSYSRNPYAHPDLPPPPPHNDREYYTVDHRTADKHYGSRFPQGPPPPQSVEPLYYQGERLVSDQTYSSGSYWPGHPAEVDRERNDRLISSRGDYVEQTGGRRSVREGERAYSARPPAHHGAASHRDYVDAYPNPDHVRRVTPHVPSSAFAYPRQRDEEGYRVSRDAAVTKRTIFTPPPQPQQLPVTSVPFSGKRGAARRELENIQINTSLDDAAANASIPRPMMKRDTSHQNENPTTKKETKLRRGFEHEHTLAANQLTDVSVERATSAAVFEEEEMNKLAPSMAEIKLGADDNFRASASIPKPDALTLHSRSTTIDNIIASAFLEDSSDLLPDSNWLEDENGD